MLVYILLGGYVDVCTPPCPCAHLLSIYIRCRRDGNWKLSPNWRQHSSFTHGSKTTTHCCNREDPCRLQLFLRLFLFKELVLSDSFGHSRWAWIAIDRALHVKMLTEKIDSSESSVFNHANLRFSFQTYFNSIWGCWLDLLQMNESYTSWN